MPRLAVLGRLALLDDGAPLPRSARRSRNLALLALLARAGEAGVSRERLAAFLWPESDADRSRHSLDQALYELRRALGANAIAGGTTLRLDPDLVPSDVAAFTRAVDDGEKQRAARLYGGPFLEGFHISRAPEFERWVEAERADLHSRYTSTLEALAREAEDGREHARAAEWWRILCAAAPFDSRAVLSLMQALVAAGDRAGALQAAAEHSARVRRDLDAAPDPSIEELADRLRGEARTSSAVAPADSRSPGLPGSDRPAAQVAAGLATPQTRLTRSWSRTALGAAVAAVAIVAIVAAMAIRSWSRLPRPVQRPGVVVEPFRNETGDPALDPLGRLAADWISDGLARTGLVEVLETDAGMRAAESVVSGSIYLIGDSVRVETRIRRAQGGVVLRSLDPVTAAAATPSSALEPLRQLVLGALGALYDPRLSSFSQASLKPPTFAAYQQFAVGLELHAVPRDLPGAEARFRAAIELDPGYVLPKPWLAWTAIMLGDWARADSVSAALQSDRERMSPLERAWHDRIAALLAGDNEASYRASRQMVSIAPQSGWVISLANAALDTHRPAIAIDALLGAGMDNLGLEREHGWFVLTAAYHQTGDYERELEASEDGIRAVGLDWGFGAPGVPALAALGRLGALERRLDELRDLPVGEDGMPRGAGALLTAVTELRAHGFPEAAESLVDRRLDSDLRAAGDGPAAAAAARARMEILYEIGRFDEARRVRRLPAPAPGQLPGGGDPEKIQAVEPPTAGPADFRQLGMTGLFAARSGDADSARRISDELAGLDDRFLFGEPMFWRARIQAVLGENDQAIASLRTAFARGQGGEAWYRLHVIRDFDPLRDLDSFRELVRPRS